MHHISKIEDYQYIKLISEAPLHYREKNNILTCPICLHLFLDPVTLPCAHSFCLVCLETPERDNTSGFDQVLCCPVCGQEHLSPES
uniref:RING-type domain-containing protein n=1 Tax=Cyprinus carpio TaxID=7962 RepID=A0A8C1NVU4_CYPCA